MLTRLVFSDVLVMMTSPGSRSQHRNLPGPVEPIGWPIYNRNFAAAEHLIKRGAQLTLPAALCLGRWSDIERLPASATLGEKQDAFVQAAMNRQAEALRRMLALGAEVVCLICGTSLTFMTSSEANAGDVTVCTFDHPEGIVPEDHTWVGRSAAWIHRADGLPVCDRNRTKPE